jgi:hypothetical protein
VVNVFASFGCGCAALGSLRLIHPGSLGCGGRDMLISIWIDHVRDDSDYQIEP